MLQYSICTSHVGWFDSRDMSTDNEKVMVITNLLQISLEIPDDLSIKTGFAEKSLIGGNIPPPPRILGNEYFKFSPGKWMREWAIYVQVISDF